MTTLTFDFQAGDAAERRSIAIGDLVIAGWTGRDPYKVQEHVEELRLLGVAPPASTPCFYRAGASLLTTATAIDCLGGESSGEAEFVILVAEDSGWWVGAGSDHTDRKVESYSIPVSKQLCPKPVAPTLWRFEDVADHWDRLELHAWVDEDGKRVPYQAGSVAAMRDPRDIAAAYRALGHELAPGTIMFGGTLPVIGGIRPCRDFSFELRDPIRGRTITHGYAARWLAD
ncbi:DUF2848 domain-containing protein [Roseomonas hellenica]|uniref:DUF2848 domain-containing protein n=1 Tax=Plastoroseomonas hellenica TaxID=2687306 RepID=A0ABS5EW97_9PROT|nr:DUF2848 domain-containing protein [Plastoroseomonas hellenica]MBR0664572.1 DUF2848 domain-containing protein [Plastoroseomonas hellenica]